MMVVPSVNIHYLLAMEIATCITRSQLQFQRGDIS